MTGERNYARVLRELRGHDETAEWRDVAHRLREVIEINKRTMANLDAVIKAQARTIADKDRLIAALKSRVSAENGGGHVG